MFELNIDTRIASVKRREKITAGSVGIQCRFAFSAEWDGLGKTAVFETDKHKIAVVLNTPAVTIPWEVCEEADLDVIVGVYGTNGNGTIVIPTIYAKLGTVAVGTTTDDADNAQTPTATDVQQITAAAANAVSTANTAKSTADEAKSIAQSVEQRANAGEFDGEDGYSPEVTMRREGNTVTITAVNKDGTQVVSVYDGERGERGEKGEPLTIVERINHAASDRPNWDTLIFSDGSQLDVMSGKNGKDGTNGKDGLTPYVGSNENWWLPIPGLPPSMGTDTGKPSRGADGIDGKDGTNGINGKDGTSVTITNISESAESGGTSVVTFSDGKTLSVKNGLDGQGGGGGGDIVIYDYASADFNTIKAAVDSGKTVIIRESGQVLSWTTPDGGGVSFGSTVLYLRQASVVTTRAEFHGAVTVSSNKYDLRLTVKKDGTKTAEAVKLGGGTEVTEQTIADWGFTKFDGSYNSLSDKPTIPDISGLYTKPDTGIPTADYADRSVTNAKIAFGAVSTGQLAGGSVTAAKLNADVDAHIIEVVEAAYPNAEGVGF